MACYVHHKEAVVTLGNEALVATFDLSGPTSYLAAIANKLTGRRLTFRAGGDCALRFSAAHRRIEIAEWSFRIASWRLDQSADRVMLILELTDGQALTIEAHYWVDAGEPVLQKQLVIRNGGGDARDLLDVDVHRLMTSEHVSDGGWGEVCVVGGELFCGLLHPAGIAQGLSGEVCLRHLLGTVLAPGAHYRSKVAVLGVGQSGEGQQAFVRYLERLCPRRRESVSLYPAYEIYDSAGSTPTECTEQLLLENLDQLAALRSSGIVFVYYAIDTGWNNPQGDLKDFDPDRFPSGPESILAKVRELGRKPGLWVAPSHGPAVFHPAIKRPDLAASQMAPPQPEQSDSENPLDVPALPGVPAVPYDVPGRAAAPRGTARRALLQVR